MRGAENHYCGFAAVEGDSVSCGPACDGGGILVRQGKVSGDVFGGGVQIDLCVVDINGVRTVFQMGGEVINENGEEKGAEWAALGDTCERANPLLVIDILELHGLPPIGEVAGKLAGDAVRAG